MLGLRGYAGISGKFMSKVQFRCVTLQVAAGLVLSKGITAISLCGLVKGQYVLQRSLRLDGVRRRNDHPSALGHRSQPEPAFIRHVLYRTGGKNLLYVHAAPERQMFSESTPNSTRRVPAVSTQATRRSR